VGGAVLTARRGAAAHARHGSFFIRRDLQADISADIQVFCFVIW
jgi:hypothetical protein